MQPYFGCFHQLLFQDFRVSLYTLGWTWISAGSASSYDDSLFWGMSQIEYGFVQVFLKLEQSWLFFLQYRCFRPFGFCIGFALAPSSLDANRARWHLLWFNSAREEGQAIAAANFILICCAQIWTSCPSVKNAWSTFFLLAYIYKETAPSCLWNFCLCNSRVEFGSHDSVPTPSPPLHL